jgi:hypothetical protein
MRRTREQRQPITVSLGFAARAEGDGVAYVRLSGKGGASESPVRVIFRCRPLPALRGRDVAYAALQAVATACLERRVPAACFRLADGSLPIDLAERRALPVALMLPYVTLRCVLNRFAFATVARGDDAELRDLTARANAEVSRTLAA